MAERSLTKRVEILEQRVGELASLPSRVGALEVQILQLRDEMRGEFSAVRLEISGLGEDLRREFRAALHSSAESLRESLQESLRAEIRQGDEETRRYMRVLHEDVIARIAALVRP